MTVGIEARWFGHAPTKPGHLPERPVQAEDLHTCDSPENIATCRHKCPFPDECYSDSKRCPLKSRQKSRQELKAELAARDEKVGALIKAGWASGEIRKELGITRSALCESERRLRERGEIG